MSRIFFISSIILILAGIILANFWVLQDLQDISTGLPLPTPDGPPIQPYGDRQTVRIGVVSRFAPNIIYAGYQPIMDYLNRNGTFAYELRLSTSYQDAVDRLRNGEVAASFLGAWITARLENEPDLVPLVAPLNSHGTSEFHAVLVVGPDSGLSSLDQLRGCRVALPAEQSWSGSWLQTTGLATVGLTVADLDTLRHFEHHQTVVWQVLRGDCDAGVVKESVARKYAKEGLRVIARSGPIPGPPLVGNRRAPAEALQEITDLLLALDAADSGDRAILTSWSPEFSFGFTRVGWPDYRNGFPARKTGP